MFVASTLTPSSRSALFDRLGIGAGGNGAKALRLLARIQAGQQVRTVDGLYKAWSSSSPPPMPPPTMPPSTSTTSNASYQEMQTAAEKQHASRGCRELWDEREQARADEELIDTFGAGRPGDTPFRLWQLRTRDPAARHRAPHNRAEERCPALRGARPRSRANSPASKGRGSSAAGGDTIKRLKAEIEAAQACP